jgi:chromosome segregation ATPase
LQLINLRVMVVFTLGEIIGRIQSLANANDKLEDKLNNLIEENINLGSTVQTLKEESEFKDSHIQKLEEDFSNLLKEYDELQSEFQAETEKTQTGKSEQPENAYKKNLVNFDYLLDLKHLKEEKNELIKENTILKKKLESFQNEINHRYIPKIDAEKKIIQIEQEKNSVIKRLSMTEVMLEKSRKEIQELKIDSVELQKELQKTDKRLSEFYSTTNNKDVGDDIILENYLNTNEEEEPIFAKPVQRKTLTRIQKSYLQEQADNYNSNQYSTNMDSNKKEEDLEKNPFINKLDRVNETVESQDENNNNISKHSEDNNGFNNNPLSALMSRADIECKPEENNVNIRLTNLDMVKSMAINNFDNMTQGKEIKARNHENKNSVSFNFKSTKTINYNQDINREFFNMTYQSLKLNHDDIEPFLYVCVLFI